MNVLGAVVTLSTLPDTVFDPAFGTRPTATLEEDAWAFFAAQIISLTAFMDAPVARATITMAATTRAEEGAERAASGRGVVDEMARPPHENLQTRLQRVARPFAPDEGEIGGRGPIQRPQLEHAGRAQSLGPAPSPARSSRPSAGFSQEGRGSCEARARLAWKLSERLKPRVGGLPGDQPPEVFLEQIAAAKASRG